PPAPPRPPRRSSDLTGFSTHERGYQIHGRRRAAGGAAQHIQILSAQRTPANLVTERLNRTTQGKARILDTLRRQHPAWRYTGLEDRKSTRLNSSHQI